MSIFGTDDLVVRVRDNGLIGERLTADLLAALEERSRLRAELAACQEARERAGALAARWKKEAWESVPPDYADRDLHHKYLKGDNEAAGLDSCADELLAALAAPSPHTGETGEQE